MTYLRTILIIISLLLPHHAYALMTIRDAEIEDIIKKIAAPIFQAAQLNPEHVSITIIQDEDFNAFVTKGQHLYINSGTIDACNNIDMLAGVIAHETGHILGGHISQRMKYHEDLTASTLTTMLLGVATAISGAPEAGAAIAYGGQHFHQRSLLQYSRQQENSADQSGLKLMKETGYNPKGLLETMNILYHHEIRSLGPYDPYMSTHPLSQERILHIRQAMPTEPSAAYPSHPELNKLYLRARTKLQAFLLPYEYEQKWKDITNLQKNPHATYAQAILAHRQHDPKKARKLIDSMIQASGPDPYLYEMKGQTAFEHGMMPEALKAYKNALNYRSDSSLMLLQTAMAEITLADDQDMPELRKSAITRLQNAVKLDPENPMIFRYLAIAHGSLGDTGKANAYLAEESFLLGDLKNTKLFAQRAKEQLSPTSKEALLIEDILSNLPKKEKK